MCKFESVRLEFWHHEIIELQEAIHSSCVPQIYTVMKQLIAANSVLNNYLQVSLTLSLIGMGLEDGDKVDHLQM